jgi:hypothetical protein
MRDKEDEAVQDKNIKARGENPKHDARRDKKVLVISRIRRKQQTQECSL